MSYRMAAWSAVASIVVCIAPYIYTLSNLITWRSALLGYDLATRLVSARPCRSESKTMR
jgi:hypothetical protein